MDNKNDFLTNEACDCCDCADDLMKLSIDDASDEDLDRLWDEVDEDEIDVCDSEKCCNKKKWIFAAIAALVVVAVITIIVCKKAKKSKED